MSDNLTIEKLLNLDESVFTKMSDITLEATVKQVGQAYERKVKSGKRAGQPFWSQKLTVSDNTGAIVVDFIANKAEQTIPKTAVGKRIKIEDAKTDIYKDERRLARGKVSLLNEQHIPGTLEEAPTLANGYYIVVGPNGKIVLNPEVDKQKRLQLLREGIAKSFVEAMQKWNKTIEKQAQEAFLWVVGKDEPKDELKPKSKKEEKPEENAIEKVEVKDEFDQLNDPDFNRDNIIKEFLKAFGELFVAGKTKGLNLGEWLSKKYQVELPGGLTDDQVAELPSAVDEMRRKE